MNAAAGTSGKAGTGLIVAALALLSAGLVLQVLGIVGGGWPTFLPAMLVAYSLPFLGWGLWARRRTRRPGAPWLARLASWVGVPLLVAGLVVDQAATGVRSTSVEAMTWSVVRVTTTGAEYVELRFRDAPDHYVRVTSAELLAELRRSGPSEIEAEFEVTRDYGRVRGFRLVRVGDVSDVRTRAAGHSCDGPCGRSPW